MALFDLHLGEHHDLCLAARVAFVFFACEAYRDVRGRCGLFACVYVYLESKPQMVRVFYIFSSVPC